MSKKFRYRGARGRFVKYGQGGKREKIKRRRKKKIPPPPPPEVHEYLVSFSYDKTGRSFDIIVTATSEDEAQQIANQFLKRDANGRKIFKAGFSGWSTIIAKGRKTNGATGKAQYREDSEEDEDEENGEE